MGFITFTAPGAGPKFVLVGEAPTPDCADKPIAWLAPFGGSCRSGKLLCARSGWTPREYLKRLDRTNILHEPIQMGFNVERAKLNALRLLGELTPARHAGLVILGRNAQRAFRWRGGVDWLEWGWVRSAERDWPAAVVPHPSGRNRWWNDEDNQRAAREFFRALEDGR